MKIRFYGAAGGVTGSKHHIEADGHKILLDCGMFQGHRKQSIELNYGLPLELTEVEAVVLSHAHLDHCGLLPLLVKRGYDGSIFCTKSTLDITELMLNDSAGIQEQDFEYLKKKHINRAEPAEPLYTLSDIPETVDAMIGLPYEHVDSEWQDVSPNARIKFYEAGHILGSASVALEIDGKHGAERVIFSGDLGRRNMPLLKNPLYPKDECDTLILESTYGNRLHQPLNSAMERLTEIVHRVADRGGKIIIPAFALGRTQELLYILHKLMISGEIPSLPVFVDSPLATSISRTFQQHQDDYDKEACDDFKHTGESPLRFPTLQYTRSVEESMALEDRPGPFIIISASGMCEAGRIRHHLRNHIGDPKNVVLIVGFMAENTLGRKIVEKVNPIPIFGRSYPVRADIETLNEFSAHAGADELADFAMSIRGLKRIFLVHGEPKQAAALKDRLLSLNSKLDIYIPQLFEEFSE